MTQHDTRSDFRASQAPNFDTNFDDGSSGKGATWLIVVGLILAALLMYFVYAGGQAAPPASPDGLIAPAPETNAPVAPAAPAAPSEG